MNNQFKTEQEIFWAGSFGDEYADRNRGLEAMAANLAYFSQILNRTQKNKRTKDLPSIDT